MKPYQKASRAGHAAPGVFIQQSPSGDGWFLKLITAIALLISPIVVAMITYNANRSSTDKDYVNIAVSILNNKDTSKENREWALRVLNRLSPIPFSKEGNESLAGGAQLLPAVKVETVKVDVPVREPPMVLVKPSDELIHKCPTIAPPKGDFSENKLIDFTNELYRCANKQKYAAQVIDLLRDTADDPQRRVGEPIPRNHSKAAGGRSQKRSSVPHQ